MQRQTVLQIKGDSRQGAPEVRMHGHTALGLHCWQALWLIVRCIAGLWGRKIIIIPHSAYEVLLQVAGQAEENSIALLPAPKLLIVCAGDWECLRAHADPSLAF